MKQVLAREAKAFLSRRGLRLTLDRDDDWEPTLDLFRLVVDAAFGPEGPARIVQIGANDGITNDPIRPLLAGGHGRAVLVEPLPEPYACLAERWAASERVTTLHAAVAARDGEQDFYVVECPDPADALRFSRLASFDRSVVEKNLPTIGRRGRIRRRPVRTVSPATVLAEGGLDGADLLQVDTEGFDAQVVGFFLDAGHRPRLIHFEHQHLSRAADQALRERLAGLGYRLARHGRDTAALLDDASG